MVLLSKKAGRKGGLLVVVMPVGRKHIHINLSLKDFVNQAMLLCDGTAPLAIAVAFQWLRMTSARLGMLFQFLNKLIGFLVGGRLRTFQFLKVFNSL